MEGIITTFIPVIHIISFGFRLIRRRVLYDGITKKIPPGFGVFLCKICREAMQRLLPAWFSPA